MLFASESSALPIALASICLTIPCICCLLLFDLCFSVPATPALLFNFSCRTSKVGIFCASSLWLFFFGLLVIPPICQLQGVLSLLFVSPFAYLNDGRECYLCWVWRWDGCAVCALKCVLGNIFLLSSFHIHTCTAIILAFLPYTTSVIEMLVSYATLLMAASSVRSAHSGNINIEYSLSQLAHTVGNVLMHKNVCKCLREAH